MWSRLDANTRGLILSLATLAALAAVDALFWLGVK